MEGCFLSQVDPEGHFGYHASSVALMVGKGGCPGLKYGAPRSFLLRYNDLNIKVMNKRYSLRRIHMKVVGYIRVSTDEQVYGFGLQETLAAIADKINAEGYTTRDGFSQ